DSVGREESDDVLAELDVEIHVDLIKLELGVTDNSVPVHVLMREDQGEVVEVLARETLVVGTGIEQPEVQLPGAERRSALRQERSEVLGGADRHPTLDVEREARRAGVQRYDTEVGADSLVELVETLQRCDGEVWRVARKGGPCRRGGEAAPPGGGFP